MQSPATPDAIEPFRVAEHVEVTDRPGQGGAGARGYAVEPSEVREMAGGMDNVLQSLQMLPGVAGTNDEDGKLAVRGAGPEHNLVVLDGVQIHNAQRLGEFTTSFLNPATAPTSRSIRPGSTRASAAACRRSSTSKRATARRLARWPRPGRSA